MISFFRYNKAPKMLVLAFLGVASSSVKTCPSGQAEAQQIIISGLERVPQSWEVCIPRVIEIHCRGKTWEYAT